MPSSEWRRRAAALLAPGALLLSACTAPEATQSPAQPSLTCASGDIVAPAPAGPAVTELRRAAESGPLYLMLAGRARATGCRFVEEAGRILLEYAFEDGGRLRVEHDPRIEYSNQEARLASPPAEEATAILARAEQAAFSPKGCGINWREAETKPGDDGHSTEMVYRGDVCSCQARVRRDGNQRIVGLVLRSTC